MIIVLIGYMGSGKSTLGRVLATKLDCDFLDLDGYIAHKEKMSVTDIFKTKGEIYFRKKETTYLKEIIKTSKNIVLALGGGTPCFAGNMEFINSQTHVISIYLKISIPNLAERLFLESDQRPLISHITTKEDLIEFIGKHLFERSYYYSQAKLTLKTDNKSKQDIIEDILVQLV